MTKHRTLRDALIGETVTVGKLAGEGPVRRRIMDMGVTKGTQIFRSEEHTSELQSP